MDYNSLVSTVGQRLNRDASQLPVADFIARAEDEIFAKLASDPLRPMQKISEQPITTSSFNAPTGFIDVIDLWASDGTETWQMVRLGLDDQSDYYSTQALPFRTQYDATKLRHYWLIGSTFTLPDTPASALDMTLRYYGKPGNLSSGNLTNWIIDSHGDVYEFGTLMHAARHLRDDDLEDRMQDRFATALGLMMDAYPERQNPTELRAMDAPWSVCRPWNVING
jgi:hypothetical protein